MFFKPKMAAKDFEQSSLPKNHKEVFFDVLKLHWGKLLLLGLLSLLFSLPMHIVAVAEELYALQLHTQAGEEPGQLVLNQVVSSNAAAVIQIPCMMIFAVGLAGLMRVIRQFAWEENMFFRYDFLTGIRQNGPQMVILAFLVGVVACICNYILNLSTLITEQGIYSWLGIIPTVVLTVVFAPPAAYASVCIAVYGNSLRQNIRIGFALYMRHPWRTLLAMACGLMIFVLQWIPIFYTMLFGRLLSSILIPFVMLAWVLYSFNALDEKLNPEFHPELVGRGTFPESTKTPKQ